jgi:hypothetical protein
MFTTDLNKEWVNIVAKQAEQIHLYDCQCCYREYEAHELFPFQDLQVCQECLETDLRLK